MNKNKFIAVGVLIVGVMLVIPLTLQSINNTPQRQLEGVEVFETQDFNGSTPKFRLNLQTNNQFSAKPKKIVLIDKTTNKVKVELPLTASQYPNECIKYDILQNTVKKWDSEWFTVNDIGSTDTNFTPKLSIKYTAQVVYEDGTTTKIYSSTNDIAGVCYQVSKITPSIPDPKEETPEN
jgi:hypothetical protein